LEAGLTDDGVIDLTRTGTLNFSQEVAFEVTVTDALRRPKIDFNPLQRWRAQTFTIYKNGRWTSFPDLKPDPAAGGPAPIAGPLPGGPGAVGPPPGGPMSSRLGGLGQQPPRPRVAATLPDFGPRQLTLDFALQGNFSVAVLADPIANLTS